MAPLLVTLDLGNSRTKAALWVVGEDAPVASAHLDTGVDLPASIASLLEAWGPEHGPMQAAALCSVGPEDLAREVAQVLGGPVKGVVLDPPEHGLEVACREPETVGLDRLFAARGARAGVAAGPLLVVDAGTAVTVDALDADGVFLGGAIAPGPALLARAMQWGTANLPLVEPSPGARGLGRNTAEALEAGASIGFAGAVAALVAEVVAEAELEAAPLFLTGGAATFLLGDGLFGSRSVTLDAHLVGRGLCVALAGALGTSVPQRRP